jgi:hypothetical protein
MLPAYTLAFLYGELSALPIICVTQQGYSVTIATALAGTILVVTSVTLREREC